MSDIFLSYVPERWETAKKLAAVFEQENWTVWWDTSKFSPGVDYDRVVTEEFSSAKVIVQLLSRPAEDKGLFALRTLEHTIRIPIVLVLLEKAELSFGRSIIPSFDLSNWNGSSVHISLPPLLNHLHTLIGTSSSRAAPPASLEELSLLKVQENARRGIQESMGSRPGGGSRFSGVFISYRRNEAAAYAGRLYDRLVAHFGKEKVFIDTENVGWGEDFVEAITEAVESCAVMIVLISPRWSRGRQEEVDDYVRLEVAMALGRKIRVIPILIQGAAMPAPKELPEDLAPLVRRNALALSDTRWERDVEDLMKSLENLLKD